MCGWIVRFIGTMWSSHVQKLMFSEVVFLLFLFWGRVLTFSFFGGRVLLILGLEVLLGWLLSGWTYLLTGLCPVVLCLATLDPFGDDSMLELMSLIHVTNIIDFKYPQLPFK